ncbi:hypothetical protein H257_14203 [Aphanomyces astaci]|uniref:Uncharacterized protein n=1 Tax=Aphanomyces astaci TaxID=112090 RepID=W4FS26_APHAT|nr:hypothetical protein H257_14203 [Aphanomyces astaci]ETV70305.1 hypothetical protein H257_14203 [Aphanomyces astaci]|eukprot:XP_009840264.1 hypothetical protein H257_14203 [Aphanomyces astaci]
MSTFGASNWGTADGGHGGGARNRWGRSHERATSMFSVAEATMRRCDDDRGRPYRRSMPDFEVTSIWEMRTTRWTGFPERELWLEARKSMLSWRSVGLHEASCCGPEVPSAERTYV